MDKEHTFGKMVENIKDNGKIIHVKGRVFMQMKIRKFMRESFKMIIKKGMEFIFIKMEIDMRVIGKLIYK